VRSFSGLNSGAQTTSVSLMILDTASSGGKVYAGGSESIGVKGVDAPARILDGGEEEVTGGQRDRVDKMRGLRGDNYAR